MTGFLRGLPFILMGLLGPGLVAAQAPPDTTGQEQATQSADAALEARLRGVFGQIEAFRNVDVRVKEGVVHLRGTVGETQDAAEAEALARQFDGTVYVTSDLTAESDLADRVTPAVDRIQTYGRSLLDFLPVGLLAMLVVLGTLGLARWVGSWDGPDALRLSPLAWGLARRVAQAGIAIVGLVITFDLLGVTSLIGALLGTAGVAGLAIGFAFRDIIENYLAGVLLSLRQPFRVNDVVAIADHEGRVVRLTARELVLLTFEGNHVRLPNATVFKSVLVNYTLNPRRLFAFDVGIGSGEDLTEAQRIGVDTLDAMNGVMEEPPPFARITTLGDSSVTVRFHGWVQQEAADFTKVQSEAIRLVKEALDAAGVEMPEPTYRIARMPDADRTAPSKGGSRAASAVRAEARTVDVTRDGRLEAQVEEEAHRADEPNLLSS